ncbi:hypothetical protein DM01DRAFT_1031581 [Hesseltinella vesiculosa]|uniref:Uncharacterized protein n=1 Tax=Hesseltinella vesiculosa TaxID=101127 RepID=A0A1X2GJA1_9FUNG|nr:hypothetical protein DM01DRAFT_1031581 [Hesseltinella vesiculosa]
MKKKEVLWETTLLACGGNWCCEPFEIIALFSESHNILVELITASGNMIMKAFCFFLGWHLHGNIIEPVVTHKILAGTNGIFWRRGHLFGLILFLFLFFGEQNSWTFWWNRYVPLTIATLSWGAHNTLLELATTSGNTITKAFYTFFGFVAFCMTSFLNWLTQGIGRNQWKLLAQGHLFRLILL